MLEFIRNRAQGLVVGVLVGFICITFALWGVQEYMNAGGDPVVAEIDGEEIPATAFYRYYSQLERSAQAMGQGIDPAEFERAEFRDRQLSAFARSQLIERAARESGMRVADELVVSNVRSTPIFQQDGAFSPEGYERALQVLGYGSVEYEDRLRDALAVGELRFGVGGSPLVTEGEARRLAALARETRSLGYTVIRRERFEETLALADEEVDAYFRDHAAEYLDPEQVAVAYLELTVAALAAEVTVADSEISDYYEANLETFRDSEKRNVNHILVQVPEDAPEADNEAARTKLSELAERARGGESFEDLAKEYSDDAASQSEGGETGDFPRGVMEPAFEEAAFALTEVGDISEPVRTKFGWHVMRLRSITPEAIKPLDDVRDEITATLKRAAGEERFYEAAERLDAPVFENPETLEVAADELALEIKQTGLKSREELALIFSPRTVEAIFSEDVLEAGLNSLPIDDRDDRIVVVRVTDRRAERAKSLSEVREAVLTKMRRERSADAAETLGKSLLAKMEEGADVAEVAASAGLDWREVKDADRNSGEVTRAVLREAFRLRPRDDGSRFHGMRLGSGDFALIALHDVTRVAPDDVKETEWRPIQQALSVMRGNGAWEWVQANVEANRPLVLYPERL